MQMSEARSELQSISNAWLSPSDSKIINPHPSLARSCESHITSNVLVSHCLLCQGSGSILSENFLPGWFLMERHSDTE